MSRKTSVKINNNVDIRYATWFKMMVDLIAPKNFFGVAGRGTAKTEDILAERSIRICKAMPGAYFAFVSDTYVNALKNIVPTLIAGWKRKGWKEGVDYVMDKAPPDHFKKPYKAPETWKHTITTRYGNHFILVSMDAPTSAAGNSFQHIFGDESKYLDFEKLKKLMPALRGYPQFGHSVYYRGMSFTTDMPNIIEGDHDWILDREKDMDIDQIKRALQTAIVLNDVRCELVNAVRDNSNKVKNLQKQLTRWTERWHRTRKDSTLYYEVSSYTNVDILTPGYFIDSLKSLGVEEFKTSVITLKPNLKVGEKFYPNLDDQHFFDEGVNKKYYEKYDFGDMPDPSSLALRYINHNAKIECGIDFGDQLSMVTGQSTKTTARLLKNFWTLPPESSKELAKQFIDFYKHHKNKTLDMYYDRSGNQYSKIKKDWATELQSLIEQKENGVSQSGWTVNLMSKNQATIFQEEEYNLMRNMLGGYNKNLPEVLIDKFNCKETKSSMELSKIKLKKNARGVTTIHKDKSSESISMKKRPMFSTNMSDALKYFFCRKPWMKEAAKRKLSKMSAPEVIG